MKLIDKDALVAEMDKIREHADEHWDVEEVWGVDKFIEKLEDSINTLEVKEVKDSSLDEFKSLQHISVDLKSTLQDLGYAPNLYYFDGNWHVDWISCEEGDSIKDFTGDTAEEAINKACNWFHSTFCNN